jgi:hypothetical protein
LVKSFQQAYNLSAQVIGRWYSLEIALQIICWPTSEVCKLREATKYQMSMC